MQKNMKKGIIKIVIVVLVFILAKFLIREGIIGAYTERIIITVGINIILALSLNLIIGYTGQLALGHAAFMAVGAYVSAIFTTKLNLPFVPAIILGAVAGGAAGFLIGWPILRLKGDYLAICTLGFGEIVKVLIQNIEYVGAARGFSGIKLFTTFGWIFLFTVLAYILIKRVVNSVYGRDMRAVSQDEIAAEAMGVNAFRAKLLGFIIGCAMAAFAGGLYAHYLMFIDPVSFDFNKSTEILTFVVLGGIGSTSGSVAGAVILTVLPEALRGFGDFIKTYRMLIYSIMIVILMIFRPQGIMGNRELSLQNLMKKGNTFNIKGGEKDGIA
ncbi:MAG: branched-chain amino acid ABC transporter permease [Lachnospiraceae bacterium]|nr:branched-chain amino acid ABC transporter permease [Lachnospiraceae bacterium]